MPNVNMRQADNGSVVIDDETDKAISYRLGVRLTEFGEIEIIDVLAPHRTVTTGVHIAAGLGRAIDMVFRKHSIPKQIVGE